MARCYPPPREVPLLHLLLLPAALAQATPDPLLRPEDRIAVRQALAAADLTTADLSFQKDYLQADGILRDRWRLPGIEALMHAPLTVPDDAARWTGGLTAAAGDPYPALVALLPAVGGTAMLDRASDPSCTPAEKKAWKKLDPRLRDAVCRVLELATGAPGRGGPGWLDPEAEATLRILLSPAGEDAWDATESQRRTRGLLAALDTLDLSRRTMLASLALQRVARLREGLQALPPEAWPQELNTFNFSGRVIQVGSLGADTTTAALTLDPGGDDVHHDPENDGLSLHLDLGGDDVWLGDTGALGGTLGGVSILEDLAGDDTYRAGLASLGAGVGGVGVLYDAAGDDSYRGLATTQGAGYAGIGLLLDPAGSDTYDAAAYAQGYAGVRGVGALWDGAGDDLYRAGGLYPDMPTRWPEHTLSLSQGFAIGLRPDAGGGMGLLVDEAGNDAYDADLFGQGCSYWFSRGYLVDRAGNDRYHVYQYGQGSGIHLSVAGLFDLAGQDAYSSANLAQGSSHDLAVGWLYDRAGDDLYAANSTGQGGSLTNAVTFFVDMAGDDGYLARQPISRGQGRYDRKMGAIGVFLDAAGTDRYDGPPGDDAAMRPWAWGVAVDNASLLPPPDAEVPLPPLLTLRPAPAEPPSDRPPASPEALAWLAEADTVGCKDLAACEAKRAEIVARGPDVLPGLLAALPRDVLEEGYTVQAIFQGLRSPEHDPVLRQMLLDHLSAGAPYVAERWVVDWLGQLGLEPAATAAALAPLAAHPNPRLRAAVVQTALQLRVAPDSLDGLAQDPDETVRAGVALAYGAAGVVVGRIVPMLDDPNVLVRYNAAEVLLGRPTEEVRPALLARWKAGAFPSPAHRRLVLELLSRMGGPEVTVILRAVAAGDADPWAQRKAAAALAGQAPFVWRAP